MKMAEEERIKVMLNEMPMACFFVDEHHTIVDCNKEAFRILGAQNKGAFADFFVNFNPEYQPDGIKSAEKAHGIIKRCFTGEDLNFEWTHRHLSGREIPCEITMKRVDWRDSYRILTYVRDMSAITSARREALEAEERTKIMLDATPFACILIDQNLRTIDCNATALRLLELGSKREILENYRDVIPERQPDGSDSLKKMMEMRQKALTEGKVKYHYTFVLRSGERLPVEVTIERVVWREGYLLAGFIHDLRELEAVNSRLREAEALTLTMLNEVPMTSCIFDETGRILDCNDEAVRLYGALDKTDLIENLFRKYSPEFQPDGSKSSELGGKMIQDNFNSPFLRFEWTQRHANGEQIPVEVTLKRVKWGEDGWRVVAYGRDLRELKRSMAEIRRTHAELVQARDAAESSMRAKSAFLANMSHEIRTPMTAIIGMTSIAKKSDDIAKMKHCLAKVENASAHLLGVINDILDISKIEAGRFTLANENFVLQEMLSQLWDVMGFRFEEKRQDFQVRVGADVPKAIFCDRQHLLQIVMNLLSNANKFTPEGGRISLFVDLVDANEADARFTLNFRIRDSGIGIRAEQLERIFKSFEQADNSISRQFGGTGLGLTISKAIVEQMGGKIRVESTPGQGSEFSFAIPVRMGTVAEEAWAEGPASKAPSDDICSEGEGGGVFEGKRILMAEDVELNYEIVASMLEETGAEICHAWNGHKVCEMFAAAPSHYDLILMDIHMPERDGYEATRHIRGMGCPEAERIPIVAMTANAFQEDVEKCLASGMNAHIAKPIDMSVMMRTLKKHLNE